ncbi:MAG: hypothetical protein Q4F05_02450 [bacterium]|nr:hypothetical protein [bacterium]
MNYDEFMNIIVQSNPSDWIYDDAKSTYIYKPNLYISIIGKEMDYSESGLFYEDWATNHPDSNARKKEFELCFNGTCVDTFYTASVDGSRMYIPYPKLESMTITQKQYAIGNIVNIPNEGYGYDSYLSRCGITVQ